MWDSKSFQPKLPVFKRALAEDGKASFSASYVKNLRDENSPVEALLAKLNIQDRLKIALIDGGSSVNLLSELVYQQLRELSQIRVCNKKKQPTMEKCL